MKALIGVAIVLVGGVVPAATYGRSGSHLPDVPPALGLTGRAVPGGFERNRGQTSPAVKFIVRSGAATAFLTGRGMMLELGRSRRPAAAGRWMLHGPGPAPELMSAGTVRLTWLHANPHPQIVPLDRYPWSVNYFEGRNSRRWRSHVPVYGRVLIRNVYPRVNLVVRLASGRVEYRWLLFAGADVKRIKVGVQGAGVALGTHGRLMMRAHGQTITQLRPRAWQVFRGRRQPVRVRYRVTGRLVGLDIGPYAARRTLVVDPTLAFATYMGSVTTAQALGTDQSGDVFLTGVAHDAVFPRLGQPPAQDSVLYVAALNSVTHAPIYVTYFGGSAEDYAFGLAVGRDGSAVVTGQTDSADFPTVRPLQPSLHAACSTAGAQTGVCDDAFVTRLSPTGSLTYSTYLGGQDADSGNAVALDGAGDMIIAGETYSSDFPLQSAIQSSHPGMLCGSDPNFQPCSDAFVTRLSPDGSLLTSTFLGGSEVDYAVGVAVDSSDNVYVSGDTGSTDFPVTPGAFQSSLYDPVGATFVAKFSPSDELLFATYLGGTQPPAGSAPSPGDTPTPTPAPPFAKTPAHSNTDGGTNNHGIAVDASGDIYVTGATLSDSLPTARGYQLQFHGDQTQAYVFELNPTGTSAIYGTYLGGTNTDVAGGIAVDAVGRAYIVGTTTSPDFPTLESLKAPPQVDRQCQDFSASKPVCADMFVAGFGSGGTPLLLSTLLGGTFDDLGLAIALDGNGHIWVSGDSSSSDFQGLSSPDTTPDVDSGVLAELSYTPPVPSPTPTSTLIVKPPHLTVHVHLGHKRIAPGQVQTITVETQLAAHIHMAVTFPNGHVMRHTATARSGRTVWHFTDPRGTPRGTDHVVLVLVRVTLRGSTVVKKLSFITSS